MPRKKRPQKPATPPDPESLRLEDDLFRTDPESLRLLDELLFPPELQEFVALEAAKLREQLELLHRLLDESHT